VLHQIERDYLADERIDRVRHRVADYLLQRRGARARSVAALQATIDKAAKQIAAAESRLLDTPDDMLPALYAQIRKLRDRQTEAQAELAQADRMAAISEKAVAEDGRAIVAHLRKLRSQLRAEDVALARRAIDTAASRIAVFTQPAESRKRLGNAARREFSHVEMDYRNPIFAIEQTAYCALHCAEHLKSMAEAILWTDLL